MQKILSSALMLGALVAGCGQQKEEASIQQPDHNLVIVRVPAGVSLEDATQAEVRALSVNVSGEQDGSALEALFSDGEAINVAQALESDAEADQASTEASRRYGRGYGRGYYGRGYGWNWGRGYRNIYYGRYAYNYSRGYGCGGYDYYPYYSNCYGYGYGCY